ncbi:MAG: matrixin family metalloprotease [Proteobacteria bacterium]|nr:matrixin family metalloprotease [Pseudomonadota bacterium]
MNKVLTAATLGLLAMTGCADSGDEYSSTAGKSFEEFKASVYREPGTGFYIVDWDYKLTSDAALHELWASMQQGQLAVYAQGGQDIVWSAAQVKALTYCVSDAFAGNKQKVIDAMAAATEQGWEKFANVNFTHDATQDANCTAANTNVMFDVNPVNSGGQYLARSFFPNDTRDVRNVLIDGDSFNPAATGNIPLGNILGHELGHVLGFRHEHIRPEANATQCAEDNNFRGVTTYDSASVMHYPQCNGTSTTLAFTQRDKDGVALIYGQPGGNMGPTAQFTFPADGATVAPTFQVQASIVDTDLVKADLYVDGALMDTVASSPFIFQVSALALGAHDLEIRATDMGGTTTIATVAVTVANGGQTGNPDNNPDPTNPNTTPPQDIVGGCSTGGSSGGLLLALALGGLVIRRRK